MTKGGRLTVPTQIAGTLAAITPVLVDRAQPTRFILFGSYGRGDFHPQSDLDLLVIQSGVENPMESAAQLRVALADVPMAIDIVVVSEAEVAARAHLRGTMLYHALREGATLYNAAGRAH